MPTKFQMYEVQKIFHYKETGQTTRSGLFCCDKLLKMVK